MLWPKSGNYEYCYKISNSKIKVFGIRRRYKYEK